MKALPTSTIASLCAVTIAAVTWRELTKKEPEPHVHHAQGKGTLLDEAFEKIDKARIT